MIQRNPKIARLQAGYLFPEITKRKQEFLKKNPQAQIISLGIGDTTEPLTKHVLHGLERGIKNLMNPETYMGYGPEQGLLELREKIATNIYQNKVSADDLFISDGAKPDTGRLQFLFGPQTTIAVQDPSYPVYVDSSVMSGLTSDFSTVLDQYEGITYLPCTEENGFFPNLEKCKEADVLFFCSPNNPTGAVATKEQLTQLVEWAIMNDVLIVFDAAYSQFIQDDKLPKSIFEIDKAKQCAIELNSFSKPAGFTGVRLGWSVVPKQLHYANGESVHQDWLRIISTVFNGSSVISQQGGIAALDDQGIQEMNSTINYYLANAKLIKDSLTKLGLTCYGGDHAPYVWVKIKNRSSWESFNLLLEKAHIICTPGSGFGPAGEGFIRFSAFGHRKDIQEAVKRLENLQNFINQ